MLLDSKLLQLIVYLQSLSRRTLEEEISGFAYWLITLCLLQETLMKTGIGSECRIDRNGQR
jgi:hypothetical protein